MTDAGQSKVITRGTYRVLGFDFELRTSSLRAAALVDDIYREFRTEPQPSATVLELYEDRTAWYPCALRWERGTLMEDVAVEPIVGYLTWFVNYQGIQKVKDRLALHASAACQHGRAVVMPAHMESGKTTLVAGLTAAGFDYLTDEVALIDPVSLRLHPYPKPLWMDDDSVEAVRRLLGDSRALGGRRLGDKHHVRPEDLRPATTTSECSVALVVAPRYVPGAPVSLEPLSRATGVALLAENCFNLSTFGAAALKPLAELVSSADCYRLTSGDLGEAVRTIRSLLDG